MSAQERRQLFAFLVVAFACGAFMASSLQGRSVVDIIAGQAGQPGLSVASPVTLVAQAPAPEPDGVVVPPEVAAPAHRVSAGMATTAAGTPDGSADRSVRPAAARAGHGNATTAKPARAAKRANHAKPARTSKARIAFARTKAPSLHARTDVRAAARGR